MSKVALVTGASRGIGKAIAHRLAESGLTVVGTATTDEGAAGITAMFTEAGLNGFGVAMNVCDEDSVTKALAVVHEKAGKPTVLVNNAGITRDNLAFRMKPEQWDDVINTNLSSIFRLTKACLKPMMRARWGRVVNISSIVGVMGNPGQANYVAAKAGLIGFTKSLGQEMAVFGITSNAVAPGLIETDMTNELTEKQQETMFDKIPMRRLGSPEDIANAVDFLVSEQAGYVTGQTIHINGGMCMV